MGHFTDPAWETAMTDTVHDVAATEPRPNRWVLEHGSDRVVIEGYGSDDDRYSVCDAYRMLGPVTYPTFDEATNAARMMLLDLKEHRKLRQRLRELEFRNSVPAEATADA